MTTPEHERYHLVRDGRLVVEWPQGTIEIMFIGYHMVVMIVCICLCARVCVRAYECVRTYACLILRVNAIVSDFNFTRALKCARVRACEVCT